MDLNVPGVGRLDLDRNSWGYSLQAGMDVNLAQNLFLNFDVKKIQIEADRKLNGNKVSHLKADPLAAGIGIGWRF